MNRIGIIISREFKERVRKKSFIIMTILTPIIMIAIGAAPTLISDGNMELMSSDITTTISLVLGMTLYMLIIIYGQQVLASVIEEKQSRVLDVMATSCKPFEMMMGKILGIAAVAAVQVAIWCALISFASQFLMPINPISLPTTFGVFYMLKLFTLLLLYIIGGFLLYASLFAAAGSAVDTNQDAQQFNTIIMLPIILGLIVMMSVFNDPNSSMALCFSIIPFTSPIVMMARIPFDIPFWQIAVSLIALYATFVLATWIAARIYRIGIFMHGKKPSWKDLGAWLKAK